MNTPPPRSHRPVRSPGPGLPFLVRRGPLRLRPAMAGRTRDAGGPPAARRTFSDQHGVEGNPDTRPRLLGRQPGPRNRWTHGPERARKTPRLRGHVERLGMTDVVLPLIGGLVLLFFSRVREFLVAGRREHATRLGVSPLVIRLTLGASGPRRRSSSPRCRAGSGPCSRVSPQRQHLSARTRQHPVDSRGSRQCLSADRGRLVALKRERVS